MCGPDQNGYAQETSGLGTGFLRSIFIPLANDALKGKEMLRNLLIVGLLVSATGAIAHGATPPEVVSESAAEMHTPTAKSQALSLTEADPVTACTGRPRSAACSFVAQGGREIGTCEAPQEQKGAKGRICLPFAKQLELHPTAAGAPVKPIAKKGN